MSTVIDSNQSTPEQCDDLYDIVEEHLFSITFDTLIKERKYNSHIEKKEIQSRSVVVLKKRLDMIIEKYYHIKTTESTVQAMRLGGSIFCHDTGVKDIYNIYLNAAEDINDVSFGTLIAGKSYSYKTPIVIARAKFPAYVWTAQSIYDLSEPMGVHKDDLAMIFYLLGVYTASLIPDKHRNAIQLEVDHIWEHVRNRMDLIKRFI